MIKPVPKDVAKMLMQPDRRFVTRTILVPNQGAQIAAGSDGADGIVEFQMPGYITGFVGCALDPANGDLLPNARGSLAVRLETLGQQTAFTTDGQAVAFVPLALACWGDQQILPITRQVDIYDKIRVTFANQRPGGGGALLARGAFLFVAQLDLEMDALTAR